MFDILSYSSFVRTMMGVIATGDSGNLASAHISVRSEHVPQESLHFSKR